MNKYVCIKQKKKKKMKNQWKNEATNFLNIFIFKKLK